MDPDHSALWVDLWAYWSLQFLVTYRKPQKAFAFANQESVLTTAPPVHLVLARFQNGNYSPKPRVRVGGCPLLQAVCLKEAAYPWVPVMELVLFPPPWLYRIASEQHPTQMLKA